MQLVSAGDTRLAFATAATANMHPPTDVGQEPEGDVAFHPICLASEDKRGGDLADKYIVRTVGHKTGFSARSHVSSRP